MSEQVIDLGKVIGRDGLNGKSAYQIAAEGGYTGTETEYNELLANVGDIQLALAAILGEE